MAPDTAAPEGTQSRGRPWWQFWRRRDALPTDLPTVEHPPICCGEAMVHNSFTGAYECADAYFWLDSERLLGDCGDLIEWRRRVTDFDRERYEHWKASWVLDRWEVGVDA